MIQEKTFKPVSLQATLFTPFLNFSTSKILASMVGTFGNLFDGETVSLPLPPDAPKEIPRIILQSKDKCWKLEISEMRMNFFGFNQEGKALDSKKFSENWEKIVGAYLSITSASVGRLAVVSIKCQEVSNPAKTLAEHFCKEKFLVAPFNRPENFELHSHKKYVLEGFEVNSWVRCKTSFLIKDMQPIILVEQDINTLAEKINDIVYPFEKIKKFLEIFIKEQKNILSIYFPND